MTSSSSSRRSTWPTNLSRTRRRIGIETMNSRVERSLAPVVARWANQDKYLLLPLFSMIASGEQLQHARLARQLGRRTDAVIAALSASLAEMDPQGRVTELFGITRDLTLHRIEVGGDILYSCCALVAHMVPAIWRQAAVIESTDPVCGRKVRLVVSSDCEVLQVEPESTRATLVDCTAEQIRASTRNTFCCHVKHFASSESATRFSDRDAARYVLSIGDFHEAAQWLYRQTWR